MLRRYPAPCEASVRSSPRPMSPATPIRTIYGSAGATDPIPLRTGALHLDAGGGRSKGGGAIELSWRPGPWTGWSHEASDYVPAVINADPGVLVSWGLGKSAQYQRSAGVSRRRKYALSRAVRRATSDRLRPTPKCPGVPFGELP